MTIREFYKKYINWIVIILICFVMIKGCQGCNKERQIEFNKATYEHIIDSLIDENNSLNKCIDSLNKCIDLKNKDIEHLNITNSTYSVAYEKLSESNKILQRTNNTLVNTNKHLTEKHDTIR